MRLRYHELVGKQVVGVDGKAAGHVMDLRAGEVDGVFRVTALLVGPTSYLRRVGLAWRRRVGDTAIDEVAWEDVERVGDKVYLRVRADDVKPVPPLTDATLGGA